MAKKKSESAPKAAPKKAPAKKPAHKAATKASTKATAKSSHATDLPSINTSHAAAAAAAMVGNRVGLGGAGASGEQRPESSAFKQMKQNLNNHSAGVADLLPQSGGQKKSNQPFTQSQQVSRNQTFGADVNRAGVPRRTGGG